jgi:DNA-binding response OmpR family regulator
MSDPIRPQKALARVLVVEDHPANGDLLQLALGSSLLEATLAASGEEALTLMARETYDMVLLDIALPGISGLEVCRQMRADEKLKHLPVIFVSGQTSEANKATAQQLGAVDFFDKPLQVLPLLARILDHLKLQENSEREGWSLQPATGL